MDRKLEIKKLLSHVSQGNIKEFKRSLNCAFEGHLDDDVALNVLITLSRSVVSADLKEKVSDDEWFDITRRCCTSISFLNGNKTDSFLRSLFFIFKYFVEQKSPKIYLKILDLVTPQWITNHNQFNQIYVHFLVLINNELIINHSKTMSSHDLLKLCLFSFKLHKYGATTKPIALYTKIYLYCSTIKQNASVTDAQKYEFVLKALDIISEVDFVKQVDVIDEAYKGLLYMTGLVVSTKGSFRENDAKTECLAGIFGAIRRCCAVSECVDVSECVERLLSVLTKPLDCYKKGDISVMSQCHQELMMLYKKYGLSNVVTRTFIQVSRILRIWGENIEECDHAVWVRVMNVTAQKTVMRLTKLIAMVVLQTKSSCNCCKECQHMFDYPQGISLLRVAGSLVYTSLGHKITDSDDLFNYCLKCLSQCLEYVEKMKISKCQKWTSNWQFVGVLIYNIGSRLYKLKNYKYAQDFYYLLAKYIIKFEGMENANMLLDNALAHSLHIFSVCCVNLQEYRKSLTYLSLLMYTSPTFRNRALESWIVVKSKNSDNTLTDLNINSVLRQDEDIILKLCPDYRYDKKIAEDLVYHEIQFYVDNWPSKIPMNSACKEFCILSNNGFLRTKIFASIWEKVMSLQDKQFCVNVDETIQIFKKHDKSDTIKVYLSVLYYIKYHIMSYEVIKKNLADMNNAVLPVEDKNLPFEDPPNPNDKCEIVPAYYSTKIENKIHLYKILQKVLDLWAEIFAEKVTNDILTVITDLKVCTLMKEVAYEYRLQNFPYHMLRMWNLHYRCARLLDNKVSMVTALGFIIEQSDCDNVHVRKLMIEADKLITDISGLDTNESQIAIVTFYINKSRSLMNCQLISDGYMALCLAEEYKIKFSELDCKMLDARILMLKSQYLLFPCQTVYLDHSNNFQVLGQNAYSMIADFYKQVGSKCPYTLSVLFEIILYNGWNYKWLRMPREVRAYSKEAALLALQIVLPIFTAKLLVLLAFTDILDGQFEDCQVKLNGLVNILGLGSTFGLLMSETDEDTNDKISELAKDVEHLSLRNEQSFETMLNVQPIKKSPLSYGSPVFPTKPFKLPSFAGHSVRCDCFYCHNLEYQRLVLDTVHLEAQLEKARANAAVAKDYFNGALTLQTQITGKYKYLLELLTSEVVDTKNCVIFSLTKELMFTYCKLLFDYSCLQLQKKKFSSVEKTIANILSIMKSEKIHNIYFWQEVMLHKLNVKLIKAEEEEEKTDLSNTNNLKVVYTTIISKTPDNKQSVAKVSVSLSPCVDSPPKNPMKSIKFNLSDTDDESESKPPIKPKFNMKTPAKTPSANQNIKIYAPSTIKAKKTVPPTPNFLQENKNIGDSVTKEKTKKFLEQRSKLLKERLKAESEKQNVAIEIQKENVPSHTVCKNLLSELSNADDNKMEAVKAGRSTRVTKAATPIDRMKRPTRVRNKSTTQTSNASDESQTLRRSARTVKRE